MLIKFNVIELCMLHISFYFFIFIILTLLFQMLNDSLLQNKIIFIDSISNLLILTLCIYGTIKYDKSLVDIALIISVISFITTISLSKYLNIENNKKQSEKYD